MDGRGPRPCSSVYSDNFSLETLVLKVDASVRDAQLQTVERLHNENVRLKAEFGRFQDLWHNCLEFFGEAFDLTLLLKGSLAECLAKRGAAERGWLASWGVREGRVGNAF